MAHRTIATPIASIHTQLQLGPRNRALPTRRMLAGGIRRGEMRHAGTMFALLAMAVLSSCGGGDSGSSGGNAAPPIQVTVSANQTTLQAGASTQITDTVSNDTADSGVTWSVACSQAD